MALQSTDFNFLSEGTIDRVIFVAEGSVNSGTFQLDIPVPNTSELMLVQASVSIDGQSWYSEESPRYGGASTGPDLSVQSYSAPSRIRIFPSNQTGVWPLYYRVVGVKI